MPKATSGYHSFMRSVGMTDRDRVVAELVPPQVGRSDAVTDAVLVDAARHGWLVPRVHPKGSVPPSQPVAPLEEILAGLSGDRGR